MKFLKELVKDNKKKDRFHVPQTITAQTSAHRTSWIRPQDRRTSFVWSVIILNVPSSSPKGSSWNLLCCSWVSAATKAMVLLGCLATKAETFLAVGGEAGNSLFFCLAACCCLFSALPAITTTISRPLLLFLNESLVRM